MKISKCKVNSCNEKADVETCKDVESSLDVDICDDQDLCDELGITETTPKSEACCLIKQAIDKLAEIAHEDETAKNSIADLSVVLFDLK